MKGGCHQEVLLTSKPTMSVARTRTSLSLSAKEQSNRPGGQGGVGLAGGVAGVAADSRAWVHTAPAT